MNRNSGAIKIKLKNLTIVVLLLLFAFSAFAELETTNSDDLTITLNYEDLEDNDDEIKLSKSLALKDTIGPKDYIFTTENVKSDYKLELDVSESTFDANEKSLTYSLTKSKVSGV